MRIAVSLVLSIAGALATHLWFLNANGNLDIEIDGRPVARLLSVNSDVQKKPLQRLIWQDVGENEILHHGDQLKTGDLASAKVEFFESDAVIDLEPGSLITIERTNDKVAIDFLEGHLFLVSEGKGTGLELKSGGQIVKDASGAIAAADPANGETSTTTTSLPSVPVIAVISPSANAEFHVDPENVQPIEWKWVSGLPANLEIDLEIGKSRSSLVKVSEGIQRLEQGLSLNLKPGDYYWKLIARDPSTEPINSGSRSSTKIFRLKVHPKRPPILTGPAANSVLKAEGLGKGILFEWSNPAQLKNLVLEVARSADLKESKKLLDVSSQLRRNVRELATGTYYWRVTGYMGQDRLPVSSAISKFEVKNDAESSSSMVGPREPASRLRPLLRPPALDVDIPNPIQARRNGSFQMKWAAVPEASKYVLEVIDKSGGVVRSEETQSTSAELKGLAPGQFQVRVHAISNENVRGLASADRSLVVPDRSDAKAPVFKGLSIDSE